VELLDDGRPSIREQAAISLAAFGNAARDHIPALTRLLTDRDPRVSMAARYALAKIPEKR
jgi:HEAT repeat protein